MSGLGRLPATSYDSHFRRIVTLYATMLCNDDVVAENIVPINELMTSIGHDIGVDFLPLLESEKRQCTPVVHSFGIAAYSAATEAFFRQQLVQEFQEKVVQHQAQIELLRTKPDNYSGTLKQYRESTKERVQTLQNATAELRKRITRYRNNELENPEQTKLTTYIQEQYERSGGFLTDAQRAYRIDELTKLAFASQIYEFYPTPHDIITEMLLPAADIQPSMTVLEPSAGTGNIASAIREQHPDTSLHVIEYNDTLREILQLKHYNVVGTDTLAYTGQQYDRIVMNPPFDMGVDIVHVMHCYEKLLKKGGRLVAIMSKRAYTDKQAFDAVKFARFVDKVGKAVGISNKRYSQELERAITIDVILVELTKPLQEEQQHAETTFLTVQPGDRVKNILTQTSYIVESVADQIVLRNTATQSVEYATALPSHRFALDTKGTTKKALPTRATKQRDPEFQTVSVVTARRELTTQAEGNHVRPAIITDIVKSYVIEGANYAIESLERTGGFLLTDGTGTGKTIQQLFVADTMHHRYRRPVLIFTESDQIIQQSFFGDARKLGMSTPDAQEFKEKLAKKPKNYSGMYGLEGAADSTTVYRFDHKVGLRDGINIGTYNDISLMFPSDPLMDKIADARRAKSAADQEYAERRSGVRKRKDLTAQDKKEFLSNIRQQQDNDARYAQLIATEDEWFTKQATLFGALAQESAVLIFDECHNLKNTGGGTLRADRGLMLTDNAKRVMFVSATPADKAGDIFYLKRAGIFKSGEHFERMMATIGYFWQKPKFNDKGEMIRRGEWKAATKFPTTAALDGMTRIFDRLTEDKAMLKREIELKNLKKNEMFDIPVPGHVITLMQNIDDTLTEQAEAAERKRPLGQILMEQKWALEPFKVDKTIELTEKAVDAGRSVVIFADLKDEGSEKAWGEKKAGTIRILKSRLEELYGADAVGVVVGVESEWEKQQRVENIKAFQSGEKRIIIATVSSGGTGISLDDTVGNAPRTIIVMTAPMNSIKVVQTLGRVVRANTKSAAEAYFLFADVDVDQWLKNLLASKIAMLGGIVAGQVSLLKPEVVEAIEAAGDEGAEAAYSAATGTVRLHSLSKVAWGREIDGTLLPAQKPLRISRIQKTGYIEEKGTARWGTVQHIQIRGKTLQDINRWAKEYESIIREHHFERESSSYLGTYYKAPFSEELWQTVLNMIQFENVAYEAQAQAIFDVGNTVVATMDIAESHVVVGTTGTVLQLRPRNGYTLYRVQWQNGNVGETVDQFQLSHPQDFSPSNAAVALSDTFDEREYEDYMHELLDTDAPTTTLNDSPTQQRFRKILQLYYSAKADGSITATEEVETLIRSIAVTLDMAALLPSSSAAPQCPPVDENGTRCITPQCLTAIQQCIDSQPQTKRLHTDAETGRYTKERQMLHREIINSFKEQKPCVSTKPMAILTGGPPGSGKSTFLKKFAPWINSGKLYHIDADEVRSRLPEYKGWNATNTHLETKDIVDRLLEEIGIPCNHDLIYDGTMNKSKNYLPLIDKLAAMGYRTFVIYIRVPKEVSVERALGRYQRSGRFVPLEVIDEVYDAGEKAMRSILERVDGYIIVDGMTQHIEERGGMELPTDRDYSQITTNAETPKTNCCTGMADKDDARNPNIIYGTATTIETPNRSIPARYALTELQSIIVSHNPINFAPDDRYPNGCQQRNYDRDSAEQLKVELGAKNFDPRFALAVTPTATDGPAIVNADKICLGGNGRTMMMKRVAKDVLKEKYVSLLQELRCLFGLTMDDIAAFQQPTLVRVVDMKPQECALFSNILNTGLTQKQDITSKTVSFARQLTPSLVAEIADLFETADRETVAQLWATPSLVFKLQKLLRSAGIVTDQNVSEWFSDAHTFTSEGRLLIEGTLLGTILPDKDFIEAARSYTDKLLRTLPAMIRMQRLPEKWNLMPDIQEIIILEAERRAANVTLDLFLQQTTFDRKEVQERTELLWRLLAASALAPWKEFITRYVKTAETEVQHQEHGGGFWEEKLEPVEVIRRLKNDIGKNTSGLHDKIEGMNNRIRSRIKGRFS